MAISKLEFFTILLIAYDIPSVYGMMMVPLVYFAFWSSLFGFFFLLAYVVQVLIFLYYRAKMLCCRFASCDLHSAAFNVFMQKNEVTTKLLYKVHVNFVLLLYFLKSIYCQSFSLFFEHSTAFNVFMQNEVTTKLLYKLFMLNCFIALFFSLSVLFLFL